MNTDFFIACAIVFGGWVSIGVFCHLVWGVRYIGFDFKKRESYSMLFLAAVLGPMAYKILVAHHRRMAQIKKIFDEVVRALEEQDKNNNKNDK